MIELDVAGLVVIAGQVLGIGAGAALSQLDIAAAQAALAEARLAPQETARPRRPRSTPAGARPHRAAAAAGAAVTLMHALLRHPPLHGRSIFRTCHTAGSVRSRL